MYTRAIIVAALGVSASAQLLPRQTLNTPTPDDPQQTQFSPECSSRVEEWTKAMPTPGPAAQSALNKLPSDGLPESGLAGLCFVASSLTGADASAFSAYELSMYSYISSQSSNLNALASSCTSDLGVPVSIFTSEVSMLLSVYSGFSAGCKDVATTVTSDASSSASSSSSSASVASSSNSGSSILTTTNAAASPTGSSGTSASGAGSSTGSSASPTPTENIGPKETGMLAMAAMAAGVIGAAVML